MVQTVRHLHEAKLDEIAAGLRGEGYVVRRGVEAGEVDFDLVAEKDGRRLAVEVKAASELRAAAKDVMRLRNLAVEKGFNDFRVFVVNEPRKKTITVPGLDTILLRIITERPVEELARLSDRTVVNQIHGVDVDSIAMEFGDVHVLGSAVAAVELSYRSSGAADPMILAAEFPMSFDLRLKPDLTLRDVVSLNANTAGFVGP